MTIASQFSKIVQEKPTKTALLSQTEGEISYNELNHYANYVADLTSLELEDTHRIVGICLKRSFKMIATMLGILKAGHSYLPLDPSYPKDRIIYTLKKSEVKYIMCDADSWEYIPDDYHKILISDFKDINNMHIKEYCCKEDTALAYIQYTSGSSGTPYGVMVTHRAIMNTLMWRIGFYNLSEDDTVLQIPSYSYASSVEDIFSTLLSGGTLVLIDSANLQNLKFLKYLITKYSVTHFLMIPSLYKEFIKQLRGNKTLRFVVIAGEPFTRELIQNHFDTLSHVSLYNEYGMTETSVACTAYKLLSTDDSNIIGSVLPNMKLLIMNKDDDGIGELYVSGIGIADGYHNDLIATGERFEIIDNNRYFRTGDYIKQSSNGNYIFIGRKDNQIKINGQRVNLSEIDYTLHILNEVKYSVTSSIKLNNKNKIITFIMADLKNVHFFKEYLGRKLPKHFLPHFICILDTFEYLPNKKINIKKMKENFKKELNEVTMRNNPIVVNLCQILYDLSDGLISSPDLYKDIQKIGIDSIEFIKFFAMIEEKFNFEFEYDEIEKFNPASISEIAKYIVKLKGVSDACGK